MDRLRRFVESDWFRRMVIAAILLNAVHIGMETDPELVRRWGGDLRVLDWEVLALFCVEMVLRFVVAVPRLAFFKEPWNWFDMIVIGAGMIPGAQFVTVIRLMRILRLVNTMRVMPGLKKISNSVFASIPSLANIVVILFLLFYIYATTGTLLYGALLPDRFGSLGRSLLTLFQMITLEGWSSVMYSVLPKAPYAWLYFISFILLGTYFALGSVVGVLIGNIKLAEQPEDRELADIAAALARIEERLERLEEKAD